MNELKVLATFLTIVVLFVYSISALSYKLNHESWELQRQQQKVCLDSGGVYLTGSIEGCFVLLDKKE